MSLSLGQERWQALTRHTDTGLVLSVQGRYVQRYTKKFVWFICKDSSSVVFCESGNSFNCHNPLLCVHVCFIVLECKDEAEEVCVCVCLHQHVYMRTSESSVFVCVRNAKCDQVCVCVCMCVFLCLQCRCVCVFSCVTV